jgi:hypothetical protein
MDTSDSYDKTEPGLRLCEQTLNLKPCNCKHSKPNASTSFKLIVVEYSIYLNELSS